jgi:glycosyltransferase involved in cell wall biosynthesis
LLTGNTTALVAAFIRELLVNPKGSWRAIRATWQLAANAGGLSIKHFAYLLQAAYLRQRAQLDRIEHIHAHLSTNATTVAMLSRLMGGPNYSFTAHGPDEFDDGTRTSIDAKLANAAFAVAISHYCTAKLMQFGGAMYRDKIKLVHCGLPMDEFHPAGEISPDNQTFVCVGRLCKQKGQVLIPAAVAILKHDFPALKVVLIGDGESRADIERAIASHGVEANIELRGWLSNHEVHEVLRNSRALVLPSFAEGLPIVIMEAFALGRPVISTCIAGIPELLDASCGWIVPAGNVEALTAALREALSATPYELAHKGAEGRVRVAASFDIDSEARKLLGHMQAALEPTVVHAIEGGKAEEEQEALQES